ncbi:hypothetical protein [Maricaulis parjimensis]|uniref:hypothetical protein n=1 Tax=Maricaulis parjimensis TaxID=144023 RepID=UPI00193A3633|nr:hypothetical protein [Maricaulis parjimensis]
MSRLCWVFVLLLVTALAVSGCATPSRTRNYEGTPEGLRAASERVLSLPDGMSAMFSARYSGDPASPAFVEFQHVASPGIISRIEAGEVEIIAISMIDRDSRDYRLVEYEASLEGLERARQVYQALPREQRRNAGIIGVHSLSDQAPTETVWQWRQSPALYVTPDYVCGSEGARSCFHRDDIRRIYWQFGRAGYQIVEPGENLVETLRALRKDGQAPVHLEVRGLAGSARSVSIQSVDEIGDLEFCGSMRRLYEDAQRQCLPFAQVESFEVWDRHRSAGERAAQGALLPFHFLGAVGMATIMAADGGG